MVEAAEIDDLDAPTSWARPRPRSPRSCRRGRRPPGRRDGWQRRRVPPTNRVGRPVRVRARTPGGGQLIASGRIPIQAIIARSRPGTDANAPHQEGAHHAASACTSRTPRSDRRTGRSETAAVGDDGAVISRGVDRRQDRRDRRDRRRFRSRSFLARRLTGPESGEPPMSSGRVARCFAHPAWMPGRLRADPGRGADVDNDEAESAGLVGVDRSGRSPRRHRMRAHE